MQQLGAETDELPRTASTDEAQPSSQVHLDDWALLFAQPAAAACTSAALAAVTATELPSTTAAPVLMTTPMPISMVMTEQEEEEEAGAELPDISDMVEDAELMSGLRFFGF